jgi:hypothetical protein
LSSSIALRASFKYIVKTVDYKERGDNDVIYKKHGGTPDQQEVRGSGVTPDLQE